MCEVERERGGIRLIKTPDYAGSITPSQDIRTPGESKTKKSDAATSTTPHSLPPCNENTDTGIPGIHTVSSAVACRRDSILCMVSNPLRLF